MSHQTFISKPFGSSARAFFQSAGISAVLLALFLTIGREFSTDSLHILFFTFISVSLAGGIAGLIFRNTAGLRGADGLKKIIGWTIGVLAYLIFVPMALILGLNGLS